ncbi:MAG: tRNA pseudouridine(55) synthase TruB [Bacteroidia bacterium]|nr:tRNA pseudouridine(55) synthase TruB [Bacteroidia bacterium]
MKWAITHFLKKNPEPHILLDPKQKLKIGHAGTLDPLATGLLLVCTGKKTKEISLLQDLTKEYTGTFFLGATTPCFDLEKEIDEHFPTEHITEELIREAAKHFTGTQMQEPPIFSAVKIKGQRAYDMARAGETFVVHSKEITISEFEITRIAIPEVDFRIVCSKGTYIRSIARDFGKKLNSGAYLQALCRSRIGNYELKDALELESFVAQLVKQS